MEKDLLIPMSIRHTVTFGKYSADVKGIVCTCRGEDQVAAYKLYDVVGRSAIVWNNCARTLYACMVRHLGAVPLPDPECVKKFQQYAESVLKTIELDDFDYSYSQWYNHLTRKQQMEMDVVVQDIEAIQAKPCVYDMFCKREVQLYKGNDLPKTRAIAGPSPGDKYVLGPVCWALEDIMAKQLPGYCGGQNWNDMELDIMKYYHDGYQILVQGDGSGFDRTQSHELKFVDRYIYTKIANSVYHIDKEIFKVKSMARYRKLRGNIIMKNEGIKRVMTATVDATVTSGNPDTTLMNTTRMALYVGFMIKEAGIDAKWKCKGDDFVIFTRNIRDAEKLKPIFAKYWAGKNEHLNKPYGLGLVLKFLKIGDFTTFDFCSTHLKCDFINEIFKISRQWDRIIEQGAYSCKMLKMSTYEKSEHVQSMIDCIKAWSGKNDLFINKYITKLAKIKCEFLNHPLYKIPSNKFKVHPSKNILPDDNHTKRESDNNELGLDYETYYKLKLRQSNNEVSDEAIFDFYDSNYSLMAIDKPWDV